MTSRQSGTQAFLVLRETSLLRLLWLAWRCRTPVVICIDPIVPQAGFILARVLDALRRRKRAIDLQRDRSDLVRYGTISEILKFTDGFRLTESWQAGYFRFAEAERDFGAYGYVYRDLCSGYVQKKLLPLHLVRDAAGHGMLEGATGDVAALYRACFDQILPPSCRPWREPWRLINTVIALAATMVTLVEMLGRIRPFHRQQGRYFLGSDFADDPRDQVFWRDLDDAPGPLMVVFRSTAQARACRDRVGGWPAIPVTAGRMGVREGLRALAEALGDVAALWWRGWRLAPELFYPLILLPAKRMRFRALFARFRFDNFWGRDDYNPEHILRSQELRRCGARSIGMSHGFHALSTVLQQTRYIDYDVYFCFGLETCRRHIAPSWPAHMKLRNISSFGFSRDDYRRMGRNRGKDIAVLPSRGGVDSPWWNAIRALALAFPDRRVLFNVKEPYRHGAFRQAIEALLADAPPNVAEYRSIDGCRAYDLLFDCSYLLAEGTTMLIEAVHAGVHAFGLNIEPDWVSNPMRDLPGLFVDDVETLIAHIRGLEAGTEHYPRAEWAGDIDLSGRLVWDQFREELGLPAKDNILEHLRFVSTDDGSPSQSPARINV